MEDFLTTPEGSSIDNTIVVTPRVAQNEDTTGFSRAADNFNLRH